MSLCVFVCLNLQALARLANANGPVVQVPHYRHRTILSRHSTGGQYSLQLVIVLGGCITGRWSLAGGSGSLGVEPCPTSYPCSAS